MKPISTVLPTGLKRRAEEIPPSKAPDCNTCGDSGYVRAALPSDHPLFGRLFPCPDCNHRAQAEPDAFGLLPADRLMAWSDILDDWDVSIAAAKRAVQEALSQASGWVYIWGEFGTAKTVLLKIAVAEYLRSHAKPAVYLRMVDLIDEIRSAYDTQFPLTAAMQKVRWYSTLPLLAVDELEKVNSTGFVEERRFQILDARYEAATRQGYGITLLAANVPPESLPGALASRVNDDRFRVVHITAEDMRPYTGEFEK